MARKKKKIEEPIFEPSKYQQAIFDFIDNEKGNLLVEAVAGSGKTTTIVEALRRIPEDKSVLFCAFNKDIVKVLAKKTKKFKNVDVRTIHGLGYIVCTNNIPTIQRQIDENKYWAEFATNTSKYTSNNKDRLGFRKWMQYQKNIKKLVSLARLTLVKTETELIDIVNKYGYNLLMDEVTVVLKLMEWGISNTKSIDYTDMLWYPNVMNFDLSVADFDYIFVDEAQDLSKAQREFILKCGNKNTRFVFVGDSNQSIYGFNAADPESFNELKKLPNITSLPLSVCYRCPKLVIDFVHGMVPEIEAKEDAINGEIKMTATLDDVQDQDMVLCRYNAPLFAVYNALVEKGKKTFIMGKDIGNNLIDVIKATQFNNLNVDLSNKGVFSALYKEYFIKRNQLMRTNKWTAELADDDGVLVQMRDTIAALTFISQNITTTAQLIDKITKLFNDTITEGIILSTIHKAKGLEAENVYVIDNSMTKQRSNLQDWEKIQEKNMMYVAYTRAKRKLGIIKQEDFAVLPNYGLTTKKLDQVEEIINDLYSDKPKRNPIRLQPIITNGKALGSKPTTRVSMPPSLGDMINNKKRKITLF